MVELFQSNAVSPGHDNIDELVNLEAISVDGRRFEVVDDLGKFSDGVKQILGDGVSRPQGGTTTGWDHTGGITLSQWSWAYYTLLGGNQSGKVTIKTQRYEPGFYIIANAILDIGDPPALTKQNRYYVPFKWNFTRLAILEEDLMYGSIYAKDASTAQTGITTSPELFTGFAADGISSGTTPAHASDNITVNFSRKYKIQFAAQFGSITASTQFKFNVRVNAVEQVIQCEFTSNATPDGEQVSMEGDLSLTAADIVTIYVETDAGGGAACTLLNGTLSVTSLSTG